KQVDNPERVTIELAQAKVLKVAKNFRNRWLLAADTIVLVGRKPLGKPQSRREAFDMLKLLSGRTHKVTTGIYLARTNSKGEIVRSYSASETTLVTFRKLSDEEIATYVATGEPMDKAGAYGIQGRAAIFATKIVGCYFNVVGLPLARLAALMREAGIEVSRLWIVKGKRVSS
ncbi:MAG: Maf family protein, partial [Armatimonadota bacterium]|nr:Maf family protein [Armatimonadota bacterium]